MKRLSMKGKSLLLIAATAAIFTVLCLSGVLPVWLGIVLFLAFTVALFMHLGSWGQSEAGIADDRWKGKSFGEVFGSFFRSPRKKEKD